MGERDETQIGTEFSYAEEEDEFPLRQTSLNISAQPDIISDADFFLNEPIKKFSCKLNNALRKKESRKKVRDGMDDIAPPIKVDFPSLDNYILRPKDDNPGTNQIFRERLDNLTREFIRAGRVILKEAVEDDINRAKAEYSQTLRRFTTECEPIFDTEYRRTRNVNSASAMGSDKETWLKEAKTKVEAKAMVIYQAQQTDKRKRDDTTTNSNKPVKGTSKEPTKNKSSGSATSNVDRNSSSRSSSSSTTSSSLPPSKKKKKTDISTNSSANGDTRPRVEAPLGEVSTSGAPLPISADFAANLSKEITANVLKELQKNGLGARTNPIPRANNQNFKGKHRNNQGGRNQAAVGNKRR